MRWTRLLSLLVIASATCLFAAESSYGPWKFHEDFSTGIPGWMSFPLPQDIGYDPSIYTTATELHPHLVRDVLAEGQQSLHVGLIRPLHFHATPSTQLNFSYSLVAGGRDSSAQVVLASTDGHQYTANIPQAAGKQALHISGEAFHVPATGADIEAIVVEANVHEPVLGSHNQLSIYDFDLEAERTPELSILSPRLMRSDSEDMLVAAAIFTPQHPLRVQFHACAPLAAKVIDGSGATAPARTDISRNVVEVRPEPDAPSGLWTMQLNCDGARSQFRVLMLNQSAGHPRVLLQKDRIEQLRNDPKYRDTITAIHDRAADLAKRIRYNPNAGESIVRMSPDSVLAGLVPYFTLLNDYCDAIAYNALDYRLSGNPTSLDAARRALLAISSWPTWTPTWFRAHGLHTYYETGIFTQKSAFGYDLIADMLSPADKATIAEAFLRNGIEPVVQEYYVNHRMPTGGSNHMAHSVGGAIAAAVALYGDVPDWQSRFGPQLANLIVTYEDLLRGLFPGDSSEAEPAGYENFAMEGMSYGIASLNSLGIVPSGTDRMLNSAWWIRYSELSPKLMLDTGDFGSSLRAFSGYAWLAQNAPHGGARNLYETSSDRNPATGAKLEDTGRKLESIPGILDLVCCTPSSASTADPPLSRVFPLRGSAALRSGWAPTDTLVSIRVGPWFNHEHHDQGSFQVSALGEMLIGEGGYTDYYRDPRYQDYFTQAVAHNTVLVDDDPFSQQAYEGRYWTAFNHTPGFGSRLLSDQLDYLSADLAPAYDGRLNRYTREYLFLKPNILVVHDHLAAAAPHEYSWLLHLSPGAEMEVAGTQVTAKRNHAVALVTTADERTKWSVQSTPIPLHDYEDLDTKPVLKREMLRLSAGTTSREADFLVGMRFLPNTRSGDALQRVKLENAEGFASPDRSSVVLFREGSGPLAESGFSTDGRILAISATAGAKQIFAAEATSLQIQGSTAVHASGPANLHLLRTDNFDELVTSVAAKVSVTIQPSRQPRELSVDGKTVAPSAGIIEFQLASGDHHVRVEY